MYGEDNIILINEVDKNERISSQEDGIHMTNMLKVHLHHIHNELDLYNRSHDEVYLMEAGEKVWVAYKFLLEQLSGTKIHSHSCQYQRSNHKEG